MELVKENFFEVLKGAIHKEKERLQLNETEEAVVQKILSQRLSAVAYEYIKENGSPEKYPQLYQSLKQQTIEISMHFYRLLPFFREWNSRLKQGNIQYYILKGFGLCSLYPSEAMRRMTDIDIYIPDEAEYKCVEQWFQEAGYQCASKETSHHREYYCRYHQDIIKCELHRKLVDNIRDKKVLHYIERMAWEELACSTAKAEILGEEFPVLPPTLNLWYLILHMLHHFMGFGIGIGPLCDVILFIEKNQEQINWKKMDTYFSKCKMEKFGQSVLYLSQKLLGESENISIIADEKLAEELLDDMWEYEDGKKMRERTPINLEKYTIISYIKICHRQMKYSFPKASENFLLWPVLWMITLVRSVRSIGARDTKQVSVVLEENQRRRKLARRILKEEQ